MTFYRALLHLYPASFRQEYGEEMCAVFARRLAGAGKWEAAWLGLAALCDVFPNALRVHVDLLRQDLRYAARVLARSPGFAASAILVAGLGIGTVTAAFSITDHVLIRPLPFPKSQDLLTLWETDTEHGGRNEVSPAHYRDWKRLATCFESMGAWATTSTNLVGAGRPERLEMSWVTADFFPTLQVQAALGRVFTAEEDAAGAAGTVVLSDRLWRERFGGESDVLGRKVLLNGDPYLVIGVMPRGFFYPSRETDLWTTMRLAEAGYAERDNTYWHVLARRRQGVSFDQARAQMRLVGAQLRREHPKEDARIDALVLRLRDEVSGQARMLLKVLLAAAAGVLLIACTNLANLLLARALARRKELAVRTALGAGGDRLVRQLFTESLVLAAAGGTLGVLLAVAAGPLVARLVPTVLPISETPPMDPKMLAFAAALTVATALAFGVLPALKARRDADASGLKEDARAGTGRTTERLRRVLVVAEVTASVTLLIGAGLLIRALWRIHSVDPGFRSAGVLTLRTTLPWPQYSETAKRVRFYDRVVAGVRALPGVASAAYVTSLPMVWRGGIWGVTLPGEPQDSPDARPVSVRYVTPDFFATMGIPIRAGRDVSESDTRQAPFVAVISESLARKVWPRENPIGKRFRVTLDDRDVVGVVGDVRVRGLETASEPQVYLPAPQVKDGDIIAYVPQVLAVRSAVPPATLLPAIRAVVAREDPQQPVSNVRLLSDILDAEIAPRAVQVRVLGAFAACALLLAGVGIHGVLAFAVSQRRREIGVRLVLGAPAGEILAMILRQGFFLAGIGVVAGLALAYATGRAMQALLFGVSPSDPATFMIAAGLGLATSLLGSLLPALRAVRVDPLAAVRTD
jgi:putative ABC transport system permease protein